MTYDEIVEWAKGQKSLNMQFWETNRWHVAKDAQTYLTQADMYERFVRILEENRQYIVKEGE